MDSKPDSEVCAGSAKYSDAVYVTGRCWGRNDNEHAPVARIKHITRAGTPVFQIEKEMFAGWEERGNFCEITRILKVHEKTKNL